MQDDEHIRQLAADQELVNLLRKNGFAGRAWDRFQEVLAEYGVSVLRVWIVTGEIFPRCREKGVGHGLCPPPSGRHWTEDEALELAGETVAVALAKFRDNVLIPGRWTPQGGATLKTFFIGQCLFRFPGLYRRWWLERYPQGATTPVSLEGDLRGNYLDSGPEADPETTVIARLSYLEHLALASDERTRRALDLRTQGYSLAEIAEMLETTEKAIESLLYRYRRRGRPDGRV